MEHQGRVGGVSLLLYQSLPLLTRRLYQPSTFSTLNLGSRSHAREKREEEVEREREREIHGVKRTGICKLIIPLYLSNPVVSYQFEILPN